MLVVVTDAMLFFGSWCCVFEERALELAEAIGGRALALKDLDNFHPEDGMVLANTTSMGMQPNVNETPISKVSPSCKQLLHSFLLQICNL